MIPKVRDVPGGAVGEVGEREAWAADEGALVTVFRRDGPALVGLARLLLDDAARAEEVVQEAFVRTYARWDRVRDREDPLPYVRRAVVNLARSGLRRRRVERRTRFAGAEEDVPSAEVTAAARARQRELADAIMTLPRRQRECVVLRFFADCSLREIAKTLGVSDGAVKQHLHRALVSLELQVDRSDECT
jgi:RNA polymerase sigma-70 factor (ECF subfamily)